MSKRKSERSGRSIPILGRFRDIRVDFVLVIIVLILYISATSTLSLQKVAVVIIGPVVAELALLGLDTYIVHWVRHALPLRSLITASFAIAIGTAIILFNSSAAIVGAVIIVLSILLIVYSFWRYRSTRDLGVGGSSAIQTENTVLFMSALLMFALGYADIATVMIACSLIVLVSGSLVFSAFLTILAAGVVQTIYLNPLYSMIVILVEALVQGYIHRTVIINTIRATSLLRMLIISVFGVMIGSAMAIVNPAAVVVGVSVIELSVLLAVYRIKKYMATKESGISKEDPVGTAGLGVLLLSILVFALGYRDIFALLFSSWLMIEFYRQLLFEIPVMLVAATLVLGLFSQLTYAVIIFAVGIIMGAVGIILKHMESEKIKSAARAKSTALKK